MATRRGSIVFALTPVWIALAPVYKNFAVSASVEAPLGSNGLALAKFAAVAPGVGTVSERTTTMCADAVLVVRVAVAVNRFDAIWRGMPDALNVWFVTVAETP